MQKTIGDGEKALDEIYKSRRKPLSSEDLKRALGGLEFSLTERDAVLKWIR